MEEVQISFRRPGEERLRACLWLPASGGPFPSVIFVSSGEDGERALAPWLAEGGFGALRLDLSHLSVERPNEAIRAAIDFLEEEEPRVDRRAVGLFASGGRVLSALHCASVDHRVRALALARPVLDTEVLRLAARVDLPACLIIGEQTGSLREARLLADVYAGPIDIQRCPGGYGDWVLGLASLLRGYFGKTLTPRLI